MQVEELTIEQCHQLAARVYNHQRLTKDDRENIRLALLELANRKAKQLYGTCWNCAQRGTCGHFAANRKTGLVCNFCARYQRDWSC